MFAHWQLPPWAECLTLLIPRQEKANSLKNLANIFSGLLSSKTKLCYWSWFTCARKCITLGKRIQGFLKRVSVTRLNHSKKVVRWQIQHTDWTEATCTTDSKRQKLLYFLKLSMQHPLSSSWLLSFVYFLIPFTKTFCSPLTRDTATYTGAHAYNPSTREATSSLSPAWVTYWVQSSLGYSVRHCLQTQ